MNTAEGENDRSLQAVILPGGLGSRLGPIVGDMSKRMLPVDGRSFLEYLLFQLRKHDVTNATLCIGQHACGIEAYFEGADRWSLELNYSRETELRGTAGALRLARGKVRATTLLILIGDSFFRHRSTPIYRYC